MRLIYHGTSESTARRALKLGILPRAASRRGGNWKHTVSSNPSMVYLTDAYAGYFALLSTNIKRERPAIIELDLDVLDQSRLYPDEDFIEQALRKRMLGESNDIKKRNRYVIRHIEDFRENWKLSLEKLGNVCFKGTIPARAITKVVLFEPKKNPAMAADSLNPTITLANYKFCGERYRAITRWFMGEDIDPATVAFGVQLPPEVISQFSYATEAIEAAGKTLQNRRGLRVIFQSKPLPLVSSI